MPCFSIVLWLHRLEKSAPKSKVVRRIGCPRCQQNLHHCGARAICKSTSSKIEGPGARFQVEPRKICTTLWRESGLEVKIVKDWHARGTFGS